jgi:hypothetical protein
MYLLYYKRMHDVYVVVCCRVLLQDGMVYHHEVLEHGDFSQRQQVVRWLRRFPFSFLSDREYTIARREFIEDGDIYACTKVRAVCPESAGCRFVCSKRPTLCALRLVV